MLTLKNHSWLVFLLEDSRCFPHEFHKSICDTSSLMHPMLCSNKITCCCFSHDFRANTMCHSPPNFVFVLNASPTRNVQSKIWIYLYAWYHLATFPDKVHFGKPWQPGPAMILSAHVHNMWILLILCRDNFFILLSKTCQNYQDRQRAGRGESWVRGDCWVNNRPLKNVWQRSGAFLLIWMRNRDFSWTALTVRRSLFDLYNRV